MKIDVKKIYDKLPSSWEQLKLKDFKKLTNVEIVEEDALTDDLFVGADNTIRTISSLTDTPVELLENLPFNALKMLADKIGFLNEAPEIQKESVINWKKPDEITYSDFTFYQTIADDVFNNMELVIKSFSKTKLSDEEILELNMKDVNTAFFLLGKDVQKSLRNQIFYTAAKAAKQASVEMLNSIRFKRS